MKPHDLVIMTSRTRPKFLVATSSAMTRSNIQTIFALFDVYANQHEGNQAVGLS